MHQGYSDTLMQEAIEAGKEGVVIKYWNKLLWNQAEINPITGAVDEALN